MINRLKSMNVKSNVYSNVFIVRSFSKISQCTVHISNCITHLTIHFVVHNVVNKKRINTIFLYMLLNKPTSLPDRTRQSFSFSFFWHLFLFWFVHFFLLLLLLIFILFLVLVFLFFICHDIQENKKYTYGCKTCVSNSFISKSRKNFFSIITVGIQKFFINHICRQFFVCG